MLQDCWTEQTGDWAAHILVSVLVRSFNNFCGDNIGFHEQSAKFRFFFPLSRILVALLTVLERFGDFTISWWDCLRLWCSSVLWSVSNIVSTHVEGYRFTQKQSWCSLYTCGTQRQRYLVCPMHYLPCEFFVHMIDMRFHCRELHTFTGRFLSHIFLSMRMKLIVICLSWELEPPIQLSFISRGLLLQDRILSLTFWNISHPSHLLRNQGSALIRCGSNALLCFLSNLAIESIYVFPD